ncbi:hypothetical protein BPOR_0189g00040 [Botrytis porri]|uniref:Uncharacterized protein n=1 Tax=Botrytis porri TaxID=87229 RepID=A0A4Z1KU37_9HELO|nr:hypothetical protein BPOR_0189g00040 [Botrytis porri]
MVHCGSWGEAAGEYSILITKEIRCTFEDNKWTSDNDSKITEGGPRTRDWRMNTLETWILECETIVLGPYRIQTDTTFSGDFKAGLSGLEVMSSAIALKQTQATEDHERQEVETFKRGSWKACMLIRPSITPSLPLDREVDSFALLKRDDRDK